MLRGISPGARMKFNDALASHVEVFTSAITRFELWSGVELGDGRPGQIRDLEDLANLAPVLAFDERDSREAARLRARLQRSGKIIGPYDLLIGAQAPARDLTLVTGNGREFRRIEGLRTISWLE